MPAVRSGQVCDAGGPCVDAGLCYIGAFKVSYELSVSVYGCGVEEFVVVVSRVRQMNSVGSWNLVAVGQQG